LSNVFHHFWNLHLFLPLFPALSHHCTINYIWKCFTTIIINFHEWIFIIWVTSLSVSSSSSSSSIATWSKAIFWGTLEHLHYKQLQHNQTFVDATLVDPKSVHILGISWRLLRSFLSFSLITHCLYFTLYQMWVVNPMLALVI